MATVEGDANSKFSAAHTTSLDDFIHKSLKDEHTECIRRIISLEAAVLPVLPTGYVFAIKYLLTYRTYRNLKHKANGRKRPDSEKRRFKRHRKANKTPHMNRLTHLFNNMRTLKFKAV